MKLVPAPRGFKSRSTLNFLVSFSFDTIVTAYSLNFIIEILSPQLEFESALVFKNSSTDFLRYPKGVDSNQLIIILDDFLCMLPLLSSKNIKW